MKAFIIIPIALIAMLASPFVLWNAESQNRADTFKSATEIDPSTDEREGYLLFKGEAQATNKVSCAETDKTEQGESCIYLSTRIEEYKEAEKKVCSETKPKEKVIRNAENSCDENGKCTPCYIVEDNSWELLESEVESSGFTIGKYEVPSFRNANLQGLAKFEKVIKAESSESFNEADEIANYYFGGTDEDYDPYYDIFEDEEETQVENFDSYIPKQGDRRITYNFIKNEEEILVAAEVKDFEAFEDEKEFVISTLSYSETLDNLKSQDSGSMWMLRILSFLMMVGGMITIFSAIASIPLLITKVIPWIGDDINKFVTGLVSGISGLIGALIWFIIFVGISILKSPLFILIVIGVAGLLAWRIWKGYGQINESGKVAK